MRTSVAALIACTIALAVPAARQALTQQPPPEPRMINQSSDPLLAPFRFRSIGPASMGGRIDDIAVSETKTGETLNGKTETEHTLNKNTRTLNNINTHTNN